jgi:hypothetical protein
MDCLTVEQGPGASQSVEDSEPGHDTGHVVFVASSPTLDDQGSFAVRVYDSAIVPHFDDTRGARRRARSCARHLNRPVTLRQRPGDTRGTSCCPCQVVRDALRYALCA